MATADESIFVSFIKTTTLQLENALPLTHLARKSQDVHEKCPHFQLQAYLRIKVQNKYGNSYAKEDEEDIPVRSTKLRNSAILMK